MTRETYGGFHFWNLYQNCRWKFFLRYVLGLIPEKSSKALLFGGAIHEAKARFWLTGGDEEETIRTFNSYMSEQEERYPDPDLFTQDSNRGVPLLRDWCEKVGRQDLADYDIVAVEQLMEPRLPNGFSLTVRPDVIFKVKHRDEYLIGETKTTSSSWTKTEETLNFSDQVIMYLWGVKNVHPEWNITAVLPDIMYQRQSVIVCKHGDLIFRTKKELKDFETQTTGLLTEISQKVKALSEGFNPVGLFDKNTSWCHSFNTVCEYADICRKVNPADTDLPEGFERSSWVERESMMSLNADRLREVLNNGRGNEISPAGDERKADTSNPIETRNGMGVADGASWHEIIKDSISKGE